jgi:hypothetical protein
VISAKCSSLGELSVRSARATSSPPSHTSATPRSDVKADDLCLSDREALSVMRRGAVDLY